MTDERPGRGRPRAFDREAVASTAIRLFAEHGYEAVSMDDVAAAAGVSRRSLFRHFASKAELVWDGFAPVERASAAALEAAESTSPFNALRAATLAAVDALPPLDATRERLRIIGARPELIAFGSGRLHTASVAQVDYLTARGVDALAARVLADGFTVAAFNAYLHWATATTDASPTPTLERAIAVLERLAEA